MFNTTPNPTSGSFSKVSYYVKSKIGLSCCTLKEFFIHADFVTSDISHMENTGSLSYTLCALPTSSYRILKDMYCCIQT